MTSNANSIIKYGEKIQYDKIAKAEKELFKKKKGDDDQDPISLKSYLDTILPPKETSENGQIYMEFVSITPATTSDVITLSVSR